MRIIYICELEVRITIPSSLFIKNAQQSKSPNNDFDIRYHIAESCYKITIDDLAIWEWYIRNLEDATMIPSS